MEQRKSDTLTRLAEVDAWIATGAAEHAASGQDRLVWRRACHFMLVAAPRLAYPARASSATHIT